MSATDDPALYPLFLKLRGRDVLVVGAGPVAERKITVLLECGAAVRVVAPRATDRIREWSGSGAVVWLGRRFEDPDADGAWLVVAATGDPTVEATVAEAAERRRAFVIAVDDPLHASAYSGSVVRRPPFTLAISSSGATPALTRLVREIVEQVLPGEDWVEHAKALRARWLASRTPPEQRFGELVRELKLRDKAGS
ncbi:MAG TPA: bifunctional precorrin-2 dehydrogenase/sirohydrochlorin ferrochelatase [Polyangiaceae bacterium]|nr:bifunctional precorrin-2 dehydrogenase/sirohydrochlorin ferrochelatase [Polyangiaceae bacterium]